MASRYPKNGDDMGPGIQTQGEIRLGKWELLSAGEDVMMFAVGRMVPLAMQAAIELLGKRVAAGVADARFVKPMDEEMLLRQARSAQLVVTLEENAVAGGFGEGVLEVLAREGVSVPVMTLGVPDRFIAHGTVQQQLEASGLSANAIATRVLERFQSIAKEA